MELYYAPKIDATNLFQLSEEESRHLIRVLRHVAGDMVELTDGKGVIYKTVIETADARQCQLRIVETIHRGSGRGYQLEIAIAPTKNIDRYEWFLEKATEIGVDRIVPVVCRHSERKEIKEERLQRVLVAALKQSKQSMLPDLKPLCDFNTFISQEPVGQKFICTLDATTLLRDAYRPGQNASVLIGPEGDFNKEELNAAMEKGFVPVSLGTSRLRTETAGLMACSVVATMNQY